MKETDGSPPAVGLVGVERTVRILRAVEEAGSAHLAEIARRTDLNEATTLRYLSTLTALGFIDRGEGPRYRLGWEVFRLGQRALGGYVPKDAIRPVMEKLVAEYNETVNFALRKDNSVVLIDVLEGSRAVKKVSDVGQVDPWHASALGKALLSTMPDEGWRALVSAAGLPRLTSHTITDPDALGEEIRATRERGFAVDAEEADEDLTCLAAAVPSADGGPAQYAVSVSFLTHRLTRQKIEEIGSRINAAAVEIGQRLH